MKAYVPLNLHTLTQGERSQMADAILALDLGTEAGWVVGTAAQHASGEWNLKGSRFSGGGMRFVNFRARLNEVHDAYPHIKAVYYEEIRRHLSTDAAHVYGGMLAILTSWCEERSIPYDGIPVGTIKLKWCGKGNASKEMMMTEAVYRGYTPIGGNEVDALAVFNVVCPLPDVGVGVKDAVT